MIDHVKYNCVICILNIIPQFILEFKLIGVYFFSLLHIN